MTCRLVGAPGIVFLGLGARGLGSGGELLVNRAQGLPQALGMLVTPRCPPVPLQPCRSWLSAALYLLQVRWRRLLPLASGPRRIRAGGSWTKASPQNKIPTWALPASVGPGLRGWSHLCGGSLGCRGAPVSSQPSGGAAQLLARPVPPSCAHSPASGCREMEAHYMGGNEQGSLAPQSPGAVGAACWALCCSLRGAGPLESLAAAL